MSQQIFLHESQEEIIFFASGSAALTSYLGQVTKDEVQQSDDSLLSIIDKLDPDEELAESISEAMKENRKLKFKTPEL
ncbi:MAG: hypothetical protein KC483_10435 [Nitrosarchaeum sp.]|nr:hypothetical protein [Nitrosarchaeum sp.]